MITDEMLCQAAARSNEIYVNCFESTCDFENQHEFSPRFRKQLKKLNTKTKHPFFCHALTRVAAVVLAILVPISAWLAVDAEAREALLGWIKEELYDVYFVYIQLTWHDNEYAYIITTYSSNIDKDFVFRMAESVQ